MFRVWAVGVALCLAGSSLMAQTPQPFPRPGATPQRPPAPSAPPDRPAAPAAQPTPQVQAAAPAPAAATTRGEPDALSLGVPLYPSAQFITSYDAGRGQRYYLYGVGATFAELVTYYRTQLKERGTLVFEEPPVQMFEVGRFRDETMAFPPGITIKDWTSGGSHGYPNPKRGAEPARFPTVLVIVPPPAVVR